MAQHPGASSPIHSGRRQFLTKSSALILAASAPSQLLAKATNPVTEKSLAFLNLHTHETLRCRYWSNGKPVAAALTQINHILRDHRTQEITQIEQQLLDLLHKLHVTSGSKAPFEIISGYRSPKTNEQLRNNSSGVAKKSLHMQGKAIDIRLPDVDLKTLRDKAIALQAGGVGYYSRSGFLHLDTGNPRNW